MEIMKRRLTIGFMCLIGAIVAPMSTSYAQLKIIPQSAIKEAANPTIAQGSTIVIENNGTLSFGTIAEESGSWSGTIDWHTTDGKKASITRITSSCNCLVAEWSRRENTAAKGGKIGIKYLPKGHAGRVQQRLFVYTTLSDERPSAIVNVVGTVTPSADRSGDYGYSIGPLLVRQKELTLPAKGGEIRVAVMNRGSSPITITHDKRMSIGGIRAHTEPTTLKSGEEGDLVVKYEPNGEPVMLYLQGVNIPPRERKIEIKIEK